jgi:hypothetical protein
VSEHHTSLDLNALLPDEVRALEGRRARWYLLVDGIDEVGGSIWSHLADLRRANSSIISILATSRPSTGLDPAEELEILRLAICEAIEGNRCSAGALGMDALRLLPRGSQLDICARLQQSGLARLELPWRHSGQIGEYARPADVVRRILYELGYR